jgi:RimJ/RimL family protein N-acetyltransferase
MTDTPPPRSAGQTLLVGPTLYVRAAEPADGTTAARWSSSPFPVPAELAEKRLRERFERGFADEMRQQLLVACLRCDDLPLGSVEIQVNGWRYAGCSLAIDPLLPPETRDAVAAEMIDILMPWLIGERHLMIAEVIVDDTMARTGDALLRQGGRLGARLREFRLVDGVRRTEQWYQVLNPEWVAMLGMPPEPVEGPVERHVRAPARPLAGALSAARPADALAIGERLYLRPFQREEGAQVAKWSLRETEIVFPEGRWVVNPHAYGHTHMTWAKPETPEKIRFGIALRENDALIGAGGVQAISWIHRTAESEMEIFRPDYRGAGYGTEAKHLMLHYAFDRLGLHAIYSYVSDTNPRSAAALRKQGYRDAGYIAWDAFGPGGLRGSWMFDLLAEEWRAARDEAAQQEE